MTYDPKTLTEFFDQYGDREVSRLESTLPGRMKAAIHRHILMRHLRPGMEVLDIGCGRGRFAQCVVEANAYVTLADLSHTQLDLARDRLSGNEHANRVRGYHAQDVTSMVAFKSDTFDLTICFGSVISYVRDDYPTALAEIKRVTRPGGVALVSVTSAYGPLRMVGTLDAADFADSIPDHLDWDALVNGSEVIMTTDGSPEFHQPMALFTADGLKNAIESSGMEVIGMATSNPTQAMGSTLDDVSTKPVAEEYLTRMEIALCERPGLLDSGEHLITIARA